MMIDYETIKLHFRYCCCQRCVPFHEYSSPPMGSFSEISLSYSYWSYLNKPKSIEDYYKAVADLPQNSYDNKYTRI